MFCDLSPSPPQIDTICPIVCPIRLPPHSPSSHCAKLSLLRHLLCPSKLDLPPPLPPKFPSNPFIHFSPPQTSKCLLTFASSPSSSPLWSSSSLPFFQFQRSPLTPKTEGIRIFSIHSPQKSLSRSIGQRSVTNLSDGTIEWYRRRRRRKGPVAKLTPSFSSLPEKPYQLMVQARRKAQNQHKEPW